MTAPVADPSRANWRELVPHEPGRLILSMLSFKDFLVRLERKDGLPRIVVRDRATGDEHVIAFDEEAFSLGLSGSYEYDTDMMRFTYSSMTTPAQVFDYDMRTRERTLLKTQEVPSGHDPDELCDAPPDGAVARRRAGAGLAALSPRHAARRHPRPACSTATAPTASPCRPPSTPTACRWPTAASSMPSPMSAAARTRAFPGTRTASGRRRRTRSATSSRWRAHLVAERYTAHDRIVAQGGSAGGMLMGAVANMAPDAFGGIIAEVPFVDVLTTMLDDTLPLTPPEWPEWGNPIASADDYRTIAAYSPYDNVGAHRLSADPGGRRPHRSARHLLGAGQMGGAAARAQDRRQSGAVQDQHGCRPCRRVRPLLAAGGDRLHLCLRAESGRAGKMKQLWKSSPECSRFRSPSQLSPTLPGGGERACQPEFCKKCCSSRPISTNRRSRAWASSPSAPSPRARSIWQLDQRFDRLIEIELYESTTGPVKDYLDRYAYPRRSDPRYIVFEADDARYMNHADDPNCDFAAGDVAYALSDIAPGEELTCDYNVFFEDGFEFLGRS